MKSTNHDTSHYATVYIMQLLSLMFKYSPQHFILKHPQSMFFHQGETSSFTFI